MTALRVATYNLCVGADLALLFDVCDLDELAAQVVTVRGQLQATRFAERACAMAVLLAREQPDLVGLQEVALWTMTPVAPDGGPGETQVLADHLPMLLEALSEAGCAYDAHAVDENFSGALPMPDGEWFGVVGRNVILVRRGGPVEVRSESTSSFTARHLVAGIEGLSFPIVRGLGVVEALVDGTPLRFVNTHTEAWDDRVRDAQRDEVLAACADADSPVVLVGDLNATPDVVGIRVGWVDAWAEVWSPGAGDGFSCGQSADLTNTPGDLTARIDYVWVRDATVTSCRLTGDRQEHRSTPHGLWPSDHACVVADLEL